MKKGTNNSKRKRKAAIKRRRNRLKFLHKELAERRDNGVDRISQLPNDILISIISRLTLREATATSVLSTRWRHLYTYITHLNFPPFKPKPGFYLQYVPEIQEKRFPNYINMINHTLDSHKGGRVLKEFRVHMYCLEGANIERWLEFALTKEVEIINIQMHYLTNARRGQYTLGLSNLIRKQNGGQSLLGLKRLKELSLSAVHVDDREVVLLLSNFPLLESLSIAFSDRLRNVSVVGHSELKLKHLDISYALNLELIEIADMINLVSLKCYVLPSTYVLRLNTIPKLTEFNTSDQRDNTLAEILPRIPSCIRDQLRLLKLSTNPRFMQTYLPTYMLPELINLKHLELEFPMRDYDDRTYPFFPLIEACRTLEKLEIKFLWCRFAIKFEDRKIRKFIPKKKLSLNLKKLKLSGYLGCPSELEFAWFITKNVVALEQLIVEPCDVTKKVRRRATARAWQHFRPTTPDSVNLRII